MSQIESNQELSSTRSGPRFGFNLSGSNFRLFYFSITILFVYFADSIMSYATPSYLEDGLKNTTLMGLVFATSSLVGFLVDFTLGNMFEKKNYRFFLRWGIIFAIGFPLGFILFPANIFTFLLGLAIWGVYYEFISFSNSQFIVEKTDRHSHEFSWGVTYFFRAFALTFGPIIAAVLLDISYNAVFFTAIGFLAIAAVLFMFNRDKVKQPKFEEKAVKSISTAKELRIWEVFSKRLWLLLLFCFAIVFIDAGFWSVGTILSEQLHTQNGGIPGLLLVLYSLPMFFMGFFSKRIASPFGKKRAAFVTALLGSIFLVLIGFTTDNALINLFVFIFACFFAVVGPEIKGVFADYDSRVNKARNSLIGLESGMYSFAYVIGPIVSGALADQFGLRQTFSILGVGMIVIVTLCLILVPRKVKLPKAELMAMDLD